MIFSDLRALVFKELIFPKTLMLSRPGVIANRTIRKFGRGEIQTRTSYYFEDIYSNLYLDSLKEMGRENADFLWYKIGKESSLRYFSFLGENKFSKRIVGLVLKNFFRIVRTGGFSFAGEVFYDPEKRSLEVVGSNSVICRKTGGCALVSGIVSGIMTYFEKENFEAEPVCSKCSKGCRILSKPGIGEKCVVDAEGLRPIKDYYEANFSSKESFRKYTSFEDFIRFNNIGFSNSESKMLFRGKTILTSEIGLGELFLKNYVEAGRGDLFERSVVRSSEKIFRDLTSEMSYPEKLKFISNLISGFGWGVPYFRKKGNVIGLTISNPFVTKYGPSHIRFVINGFLNEIYGKRFKVKMSENDRVLFEA